MNILVFCPWSHLHELAALTIPNKEEYAALHGYEFQTHELGGEGINIEGEYGYRRMGFTLEKLKRGEWDWIWVVGLDVLVTNMAIKLESIIDDNFGLIHSADALDPCLACMDSFLVSPKAIPLLEDVMSYRDNPIGGLQEQSTTFALAEAPPFAGVRKLLPQRVMNSYQYQSPNMVVYGHTSPNWVKGIDSLGNSGEWQPGDFVLHVAATNSVEFKVAFIREFLPKVQR